MTTKITNFVGIDYSLTSPAICSFAGKEFKFEYCKFYFVANKKVQNIHTDQFYGIDFSDFEFLCPEQRYDTLANFAMLGINEQSYVCIEGLSMGSRGSRILQIAENCEVLKYRLWRKKIHYEIAPPKTVKKFATGNGNASKEMMYDSFLEETKFNLHELLQTEGLKNTSPTSDIVDSYFICKYGYTQFMEQQRP